MHTLLRTAACLAVFFAPAVVSYAAAQEATHEASGCNARFDGEYGTLSYAEDGSVTETTQGDFKLWVCKGLYFTFDDGAAVEVAQVFDSQEQFDWFVSDLNYIVSSFIPVADEIAGNTETTFTLPPSRKDLDHRPAHLLIRAVDMAPAGIALRSVGDDTLRFFYFEDMTGPAFKAGG